MTRSNTTSDIASHYTVNPCRWTRTSFVYHNARYVLLRSHATGDAYFSRHMVPLHLGLACALLMPALSKTCHNIPDFEPRISLVNSILLTFYFSNRDTSYVKERLKSSLKKFMVDMGILSNNTKFLSHEY